MTLLPLASFLAGALMTILMPTLVLIAVTTALIHMAKRVPGGDASQARRATRAERNPAYVGPQPTVEGPGSTTASPTDRPPSSL
jgi:hypothetical protein